MLLYTQWPLFDLWRVLKTRVFLCDFQGIAFTYLCSMYYYLTNPSMVNFQTLWHPLSLPRPKSLDDLYVSLPPFTRIFRCSQSNCAPAMAVRSSFLFFSGRATLDISFVTYTTTTTTQHMQQAAARHTPRRRQSREFSTILLGGHVTFVRNEL